MAQLVYNAFNKEVLDYINLNGKTGIRILDIGCGSGNLGAYLKSIWPTVQIVGVTFSQEEANLARLYLDEVIELDINLINDQSISGKFDYIICSHVLEHLYNPQKVLNVLSVYLNNGGYLVIALPNVLYYKQRVKFALGYFRYSEYGGIMDTTHYRFFDFFSAKSLVWNSSDLILESTKAIGNFPLPFFRRIFPEIARKVDGFFCTLFPGLFGAQFILLAKRKL